GTFGFASGPADPPAGRILGTGHPANQTWTADVDSPTAATLVVHLTALPGWHATVDGRAVPVRPYPPFMEEITLPPGRHTVVVRYWPDLLTAGLVVAGASAVLLAAGAAGAAYLRRRR
ncbi:MAG TPA: YfhO family protein, partial [Acidimicrobiales bacterium]|nr:YfhO family protein [Acidimicrobiales bacterium]